MSTIAAPTRIRGCNGSCAEVADDELHVVFSRVFTQHGMFAASKVPQAIFLNPTILLSTFLHDMGNPKTERIMAHHSHHIVEIRSSHLHAVGLELDKTEDSWSAAVHALHEESGILSRQDDVSAARNVARRLIEMGVPASDVRIMRVEHVPVSIDVPDSEMGDELKDIWQEAVRGHWRSERELPEWVSEDIRKDYLRLHGDEIDTLIQQTSRQPFLEYVASGLWMQGAMAPAQGSFHHQCILKAEGLTAISRYLSSDMRLYRWYSEALKNYGYGHAFAIGRSPDDARLAAMAAYKEFLASDAWWGETPDADGNFRCDDDREDYEAAIARFEADLREEPAAVGEAFVVKGSE